MPKESPTSCLPINVLDLLHQRMVEAPRIELKGSWNEGPTADQVLRTICAFANDFPQRTRFGGEPGAVSLLNAVLKNWRTG